MANSQPKVGVDSGRDVRGETRPGWNLWKGVIALFWAAIE